VDIYDYHRGKLGARRLANFIRRLPRDSETAKEVYGEDAEWSRHEHLLAIVADRLAVLDWHFVCSKTSPDDHPPRPTPIPRPGVEANAEPEPIPEASAGDIAKFFK
jgi:hypothetical protein